MAKDEAAKKGKNLILKKIIKNVFIALLLPFFVGTALSNGNCIDQFFNCNVLTSSVDCCQLFSLDNVVNTAFNSRESLKAARFNINEFREFQVAALAPYLPQFSLTSLVTKVNRTRISSIDPKHSVVLTLRQLVWDFLRTIELYRAAKHETNIAILQELLERDSIQFQAESSLLKLHSVVEQKASIDALNKSSKVQIDRSIHMKKIGLLNKQEWLESLEQYEQSISDIRRYNDELNTARSELQRAIGSDVGSSQDWCLPDAYDVVLTPTLYCVQWYRDFALENRKEIKIKNEEILREKNIKLSEQKAYSPQFAFFSRVSRDAFRGGSSITPWRVGLEITWEFDGFAHAKQASAADYRVKKFKMLKCDTIQQIKLEVDDAYYTVESLLKQLSAEYAGYFRSSDKFELKKKEYIIGKLAETDFIQAQTEWELARVKLINFKINMDISYRKLLFVTGYPC